MRNNTKLARAVALAMTGTALSAGGISTASASTTMYNTFNSGQAPGYVAGAASTDTDGWTHSGGPGNGGPLTPWLGTAGFARPFGYTGSAALSWAAELDGVGDSATISAADSQAKYRISADIDTAKGAWQDASLPPNGPQGWRHQLDLGLVASKVAQQITLTPSTVDTTFASNFGISVYKGMDASASWSHHGSWNRGYVAGDTSPANLAKVNGNDPIGTSGLTFLTFMDSSGLGPYGGHSVTFEAEAGQVYTILLGGRDGGTSWREPIGGYKVEISSVPIPAAVWLFGSALTGLGVIGSRKTPAVIA